MGIPIIKEHRNFAIIDVENCRSQLRFLPNYVQCFDKVFIAYSDYYIRSAIDYEINNIGKKIADKKIEICFIDEKLHKFENKRNLADIELMFWTFKLVYDIYHKRKFDKKCDVFLVSEDTAFSVFKDILKVKYPRVNIRIIMGNSYFLLNPNSVIDEPLIIDKKHFCFESKSNLRYSPLRDLSSKEFIITTVRMSDGYEYTRKYKNLEKVYIETLVKHKVIPMYVDRLTLDDIIIMKNQKHRIKRIEAINITK